MCLTGLLSMLLRLRVRLTGLLLMLLGLALSLCRGICGVMRLGTRLVRFGGALLRMIVSLGSLFRMVLGR
jgi:hypothetical protein